MGACTAPHLTTHCLNQNLLFPRCIDGVPHACDVNVSVLVIGVKLEFSPTHCIKKECRHTGLEKEGGCAWHGYVEVVNVRALDKVVSNNPLTTVREEPCLVADTGEFLIQVHQVEVVVEGDILHHFFYLKGLIFFVLDGSGSAGRRDLGGGQLPFLLLHFFHHLRRSWVLCAKNNGEFLIRRRVNAHNKTYLELL